MLDSTSAAEKVGILGLIGGIFVACVQAVRWIANFSQEHEEFKAHLLKTEPMIERFIAMEEASKQAKVERAEIIDELRGLRQEINEVLKLMIARYQ